MKNKNILLGITSGIAIYKIPEIIRILKKKEYNIKTILTPNAQKMMSPVIFQTLTGNKVYTDTFDYNYNPDIKHIALSKWADLIVIAPATANTINKITCGIADNLLLNTIISTKTKVLIVPAMNTNMYEYFATQHSIDILSNYNFEFLGPVAGSLACGDIGKGKMIDVNTICKKIESIIMYKNDLKDKKILVTSGATREKIDAVRFITNYSTGKQGYNIAKAASLRGAEVLLISGWTTEDTNNSTFKTIKIENAEEMHNEVMKHIINYDYIISAAAISDFKPENYFKEKIKKGTKTEMTLNLIKTKDILSELKDKTRIKKIGFAAETENIIQNGKKKLEDKRLDYIVINDVSKADTGFESDYNKVTILDKTGKTYKSEKMSKYDISNFIIDITIKSSE